MRPTASKEKKAAVGWVWDSGVGSVARAQRAWPNLTYGCLNCMPFRLTVTLPESS